MVTLFTVIFPLLLEAKTSSWTDETGASFKGELTEVIGPFAMFRRSATSGKFVPLGALSSDLCVRVYSECSARPPRAFDWSQAAGLVTKPLLGNVQRVQGEKLVPADLAGRPEPQILVVIYGSSGDGASWSMLGDFVPTYRRIQRLYPGLVEAVFFGVRHDSEGHRAITTKMGVPWLVTNFHAQVSLGPLQRLAPAEDRLMLALTREGVPIAVSTAGSVQEVAKFVDELTDFLRAIDPDNMRTWRDRLHYANATRPAQFASAKADPQLMGNPLNEEALRRNGVKRLSATVSVGADGRVASIVIDPSSQMPDSLRASMPDVLKQALVISPAIDYGRPVAGTMPFLIEVPEVPLHTSVEVQWMKPTAPEKVELKHWLVLKPVPVPEKCFAEVDYIDETGALVMKEIVTPIQGVSQAQQKNAFNSDWFDGRGAASVAPVQGERQVVDGVELKWRAVNSDGGFVNLQAFNRRDYCIGYAWTEVELAKDAQGWMAIGSDDGVKIWLNGELILDKWIRRPSRLDDDIVPMRLRAGKNRILIKIQNMSDDWSFIARLRLRG